MFLFPVVNEYESYQSGSQNTTMPKSMSPAQHHLATLRWWKEPGGAYRLVPARAGRPYATAVGIRFRNGAGFNRNARKPISDVTVYLIVESVQEQLAVEHYAVHTLTVVLFPRVSECDRLPHCSISPMCEGMC